MLVSIEEYLHTSYHPDREYVDSRQGRPDIRVWLFSAGRNEIANKGDTAAWRHFFRILFVPIARQECLAYLLTLAAVPSKPKTMDKTNVLVPINEYLHTNYDPDREYVDGVVLERNWGELTHSWIQGLLIHFLFEVSKKGAIYAFPELRVQVKPTRFRVPDVTVVRGPRPHGFILNTPPYLVIEILSREDRITGMQEKIDDYLTFGIPYIWIINPLLQKGFVVTSAGMIEAKNGFLETDDPAVRVPLPLVFS